MKSLDYRPEIDGLRAIAVLAVVVFHAGVDFLSGGFIGVDIFFVISGYLISAIIIRSIVHKQFSFSQFYSRRAKRLLPAALLVILVTVIFAAVILSPEKYYELAKSAQFSTLFMANIWFAKHSGYFDISTQISPLVHLWSLSVEEQFYFIYPFILFAAYKIAKRKAIIASIALITVASLFLNVLLIKEFPNFTFYTLPTRAWQLGLGAMIYLIPHIKNYRINSLLSIIAIMTIFYTLISIAKDDLYPGYLALAPTLSAAVLLYSLHSRYNIVRYLLSTKPLVFIGKISYSTYLWHWPIIVFYRIYINERSFFASEVIILICASFIAGYFSYIYIENKFRYYNISTSSVYKTSACALTVTTLLISSVLITRGFPNRISDELAMITNQSLMRKLSCVETIGPLGGLDGDYCVIGAPWDKAKRKGMVWGDSHSAHFGQMLHQQALSKGISLVIAPRECPAYLDDSNIGSHYPKYPNYTEDCRVSNALAMEWLKSNQDVDLLILAAYWSSQVRMHYSDESQQNRSSSSILDRDPEIGAQLATKAFKRMLSKVYDKEVLIISDVPSPLVNINECAFSESTNLLRQKCSDDRYKFLDANQTTLWHKRSDQMINEMAKSFSNVSAIFPRKHLCTEVKCQTYVNGELIYRDDDHIRTNLRAKTVQELSEKLQIDDYFNNL